MSAWSASRAPASRAWSRRSRAARPKIADYPFTTLVPNLGVVEAGETRFTVADVPGLIQGASEGRGLGHEFLRHVERCAALVHVVDCATLEPGRDPLSDVDVIEAELAAYGGLADRPRIVALNKVDVPEARELAELVRPDLGARGWPVFCSCRPRPTRACASWPTPWPRSFGDARAAMPAPAPTRIVLRPTAVDESRLHGDRARASGSGCAACKPERWVRQTDFCNDEAVGYLADRLARLGVEQALVEAGAVAGDRGASSGRRTTPCLRLGADRRGAGPQPLAGPRGTDRRLERRAGRDRAVQPERRSAVVRRAPGRGQGRLDAR